MKYRVWSVGLMSALLAVSVTKVSAQEDVVRIGVLLPYKGIYASLAENFENGWKIALAEYEGKIGKKIELFREDDESTPNVAIQKADKLIQSSKVHLMIGIVSGGVGVGMAQYAAQRKMPLVLGFAIPDVITAANCNAYVSRTSFSAYAYTSAMGKYWASKFNTAVTLGPDYATGHAMLDGFADGFKAAGKKIVAMHYTPFGTTKDFGPAFAKMKENKADMVFSFYAGGEAVQVMKQYHDFGMKNAMGPLRGDLFLYDPELWTAMGPAVVGGIFGTLAHHSVDSPANNAFTAAYRKAYSKDPDVNSVLGYDNGKTTMMGLQKVKGDVSDPVKFVAALRTVEYDSPRGKFRINKDGNAQIEKLYIYEVVEKGGKPDVKLLDTIPGGQDRPGCTMK